MWLAILFAKCDGKIYVVLTVVLGISQCVSSEVCHERESFRWKSSILELGFSLLKLQNQIDAMSFSETKCLPRFAASS